MATFYPRDDLKHEWKGEAESFLATGADQSLRLTTPQETGEAPGLDDPFAIERDACSE